MPNYILTGTPGAGKTVVLRQLEFNGHAVVEEAATDVIALEQSMGHETPWKEPTFVDKIVALQRRRQMRAGTAGGGAVFFDRSPICTLALSRHLGIATSRVLADEVHRVCTAGVYEKSVFFLRNLGFVEATAARQISFEASLDFERLHEETYRECGFRLIDVPSGPLTDRVALVQQTVGQLQAATTQHPLKAR